MLLDELVNRRVVDLKLVLIAAEGKIRFAPLN